MSWGIVIFFVSVFVQYSRQILTNDARPNAPGFADINTPTAEDGRVIPVLFGTRDIKSANCVWYGNLYTYQVRQRNNYPWQSIHHDLFFRTPYIAFSPL